MGHVEAMGAWVDAYCSHPEEMNTNFGIIELGGASLQIMSNVHTKHCFSFLGQDASMRLLANEYNKEECICQKEWEECKCQKHYTAKDNASPHKIFTEEGEPTLKDLVKEHIFTQKNIADIKKYLGQQENYFLVGALFNFQREFKDFDIEDGTAPCPRGCEGNDCDLCKGTGFVNLIGFIAGNDTCPEFAECVDEKYQRTDRYVFYFLKKPFEEFGNIKVAKAAVSNKGKPTDLSWPRGLAIMQPHDISQNTEMNREELRSLLDGLREGKVNVPVRVFCKNCQTSQYTNDPKYTCGGCDDDTGKFLMSSADYETWSEQRSASKRSESPMSAISERRRLMNRLLQEIHRRN